MPLVPSEPETGQPSRRKRGWLVLILPKNSVTPTKNPRARKEKGEMLPPPGIYLYRNDQFGNGNLRSCDASTQGIYYNAKLVMSGAPRFGELCFDENPENWKFD